MIVLRVTARGRTREVRSEGARVRLGSDPAADVCETDVGWQPEEALLLHHGTEVELRRAGGGDLRLRVGDGVRLGHARLTLVGLLPLPGGAPGGDGRGAPVFGGYDEGLTARPPPPFELADAPPPPGAVPRADVPARPPPPEAPERAAADAGDAAPEAPGRTPLPRPPAPAFKTPRFDEELLRQLKRAPYFAVSVALHVLVFLVFSLLRAGPEEAGSTGEEGTLHAALLEAAERQRVHEDEQEPESQLPTPLLREIPPPTMPEDELRSDQASEVRETLEARPDRDPLPFQVGLLPSLRSVESGSGSTRVRVSKSDLQETFTKGEARSTNQRAADYVRARLGRGSGRRGNPLEGLVRSDLLVVEGTFDHVDHVLEDLRLPFQSVTPASIARRNAPDLAGHKVVFWNCGESLPEEQLRVAARRIRSFVKEGGFLFTTDWTVAHLLQAAFPGFLSTSGPRAPLPETVVRIAPAPGQGAHRLLAGVFRRGVEGRWWLEQASFDVRVENSRWVTVLIESPDLEKKYRRSRAVAVTFPYGKGHVLHVMGHYYQEEGNLQGAIAAQRLALNFVLMRLERD